MTMALLLECWTQRIKVLKTIIKVKNKNVYFRDLLISYVFTNI